MTQAVQWNTFLASCSAPPSSTICTQLPRCYPRLYMPTLYTHRGSSEISLSAVDQDVLASIPLQSINSCQNSSQILGIRFCQRLLIGGRCSIILSGTGPRRCVLAFSSVFLPVCWLNRVLHWQLMQKKSAAKATASTALKVKLMEEQLGDIEAALKLTAHAVRCACIVRDGFSLATLQETIRGAGQGSG